MGGWLEQFNQLDATTRLIVAVAGGLVALLLAGGLWRRLRFRQLAARHRRDVKRSLKAVEQARAQRQAQASRVIATSSSGELRGFELTRQIEAVFTDGHRTPAEAVEAVKAQAAERGANALINLHSQRLANGNCVAQADAVIVRPTEAGTDPEQGTE